MRPRLRTALIIPALNEAEVIGLTLSKIPSDIYDLVIVADNGSTDRTGEIARHAGATVVREEERGYGAACLKAIQSLPVNIEAVVFMQSDLSEDPNEARLLLEPLQNGCADMVLGSRTLGLAAQGALLPQQKFGNWVATTAIRLLYRYQYTDLGPYRAIRKDALDRLRMRDRNYGWTIEMQIRAIEEKLRVREIPVSYGVRVAGENKISGSFRAGIVATYRIIITVLRLRFGKRSASR
jgi:glycosyltransferase involved in cell wall biosynthesis